MIWFFFTVVARKNSMSKSSPSFHFPEIVPCRVWIHSHPAQLILARGRLTKRLRVEKHIQVISPLRLENEKRYGVAVAYFICLDV